MTEFKRYSALRLLHCYRGLGQLYYLLAFYLGWLWGHPCGSGQRAKDRHHGSYAFRSHGGVRGVHRHLQTFGVGGGILCELHTYLIVRATKGRMVALYHPNGTWGLDGSWSS